VTSNPERGARDAVEPLHTSAFDYDLPDHLIAHHPAAERDASRLLVVRRDRDTFEHRRFRDIADLIPAGDILVLNETRVFPARLLGARAGGGEAEIVLLHPVARAVERTSGRADGNRAGDEASGRADDVGRAEERESGGAEEYFGAGDWPSDWTALVRPGSKLKPGRRIRVGEDLEVEIVGVLDDGARHVRLHSSLPVRTAVQRYGHMPLPPYIDRPDDAGDRERYQTVYGSREGSVAAPTAGLHFTPALLDALRGKGVEIARVLLHVGVGTFRPVEVDDPSQHVMHAEWYEVSESEAEAMNRVRWRGGRLWAVGTTVARTLESVVERDVAQPATSAAAPAAGTPGDAGVRDVARIRAGSGWTRLFIRPGFDFAAVDCLITNFHLPRSTLLMLVSALAGHERIMSAYAEAVREEYRFYSYGDAMVIL
jgi:S-adenosylmethionine:tRNA ribosyltransferase-isomerase